MNESPVIEATADGSCTLYSPLFGECYHSTKGAVQESVHVFIEAGFNAVARSVSHVEILETGFGTGLNALLTCRQASANRRKVRYTSIEKYPLPAPLQEEYYRLLGIEQDLAQAICASPWGVETVITDCFTLLKTEADFTEMTAGDFSAAPSLVYFDAFSPETQPEMWTQERFEMLHSICCSGAIMVTYCAKGEVRRRMQRACFITERLPGAAGKREMLRARKV